MKNNEAWKPYLEAAEKATEEANEGNDWDVNSSRVLLRFINGYPKKLRVVVALGLSLAKWFLYADQGITIMGREWVNCACCALYNLEGNLGKASCDICPLGPTARHCVVRVLREKVYQTTYARILTVYTSHFNALPARDRQRVTG